METTSLAPLRTVRDCRWTRHGYRVSGVPDQLQPETPWVCVRTGDRQSVSAEECLYCPYWEAEPARRLH